MSSTSQEKSAKTLECDVVIVGAGPSGSAAALKLSQLGVKNVVLLDLNDFPRNKTCGSGLSPRGIKTLQDLNIWERIEPISYPISGLRIVTREGNESYISGGDKSGAAICLRHDLDNEIFKAAIEGGVQFRPDAKVVEPIIENGRWCGVRTSKGLEVRAKHVLVANGAHSKLSTATGPKRTIHAIMGWWDNVDYRQNHVEMYWDKLVVPYYGWLFPESDTRVNIGITYEDDNKEKNARKLFQEFLDKYFQDRLTNATQVGKWKGHPIVYTYNTGKLWSPGRVVLGEAGRMTHPVTGEGISQAMRSGMFAAEAVHEILTGQKSERSALNRYSRRCAQAFLPSFWAGGAFRKILYTPFLDKVVSVSAIPKVGEVTARFLAHI